MNEEPNTESEIEQDKKNQTRIKDFVKDREKNQTKKWQETTNRNENCRIM